MEAFILILVTMLLAYSILGRLLPLVDKVEQLPNGKLTDSNIFKVRIVSQDNFKGILAKEYYKIKSKWSVRFILGLLLDKENTVRELEIMGHAISVEYSADPDLTRKIYSNNLKTHYHVFSDVSLDVIYEMLSENTFFARQWVRDNNYKLTKLVDKLLLGG